MSLPEAGEAYAVGPEEGEEFWFNGALLRIKATSEQTAGRFTAVEFVTPKGFASPLHVHQDKDEIFLVLAGNVRFQLGQEVIQGVPGSLVYGPHGVNHGFHCDTQDARLLLLFGPAGAERFFREAGKPALSHGLPPAGEQFLDRDTLIEIAKRHGQDFVGPPLPPL